MTKSQLSAETNAFIFENSNEEITATNVNKLVLDIIDAMALESELSGGTGTPGGVNTEVQFNDNGVFGGVSGFTYDKDLGNFMVQSTNSGSQIIGSTGATIIGTGYFPFYGGFLPNYIVDSNGAIIIGIGHNIVSGSSFSTIFGGGFNQIPNLGNESSSIISSFNSQIANKSGNANIIGSYQGVINNYSSYSLIIGGGDNFLNNYSKYVSLVNTVSGYTSCSYNSSIMGGTLHTISQSSNLSSIVGGSKNILTNHATYASIIGGSVNTINDSAKSSILGGINNEIYSSNNSSIVGGLSNCISNHSSESSIIGGQNSKIYNSYNSAIIGGNGLILSGITDTVFVPNLQINANISVNSGGTFSDGITGVYTVGLNTFTIVNGVVIGLV